MIINSKFRWIVFVYFLINDINLYAQDNNYWTQQYGNVSTMLGGAVTGSYKDNGSIYYNPATLAFTDSIKFSFGAALYQSSFNHVSNATADDTSDYAYGFKRFPITFYPVFRLDKRSRLGFIYLQRIYSSFNLHDYRNQFQDITSSGSSNQFIGTFDYQNKVEESWYGVSYSRTLSPHSSVGVCLYGIYRFQDFFYHYNANAVISQQNQQYIVTDIYHSFNYDIYQGLIKMGYYYEWEDFSAGCAITLPSFLVLSYSRSSSRFYFSGYKNYLPSDTINNLLITDEQRNSKTNHKYPGSISLGFKNKFNGFTLYVTSEFFTPVKQYQLVELEESENAFPIDYQQVSNLLLNAETAVRFFANIGAGLEFKLKSNKELIAGFSTDFNALPKDFDPGGFNVSTGRNNIFHLSAGMDVHVRKIKINGGLKLSYGASSGFQQFVDMKSATAQNLLVGYRDYNSNYRYYGLNLLLGFNF